ncbi:MBL fold metallo-hydrolase [Virgibacillus halophilus]|uniref:MBL fold metallo-hydrolase n=1 Tax=Tigheibacillus halophilus TaxID=361280 RepID=UPI00363D3CC9
MEQIQYACHEDIEIVKIPVNPFYRLMSVHLYYIDGMLVDTGPRIQKQQLKKVFSAWNVQQVALTHSHEDHTGMASWIAKHKNADIFCHERMVKAAARKAHLPWYRELFIGPRFGFSAQAYPNVLQTSKHQFLPIETPGHTTDHICLFEPDKGWLFTGDLYVTPYPKVFMKEESISDYIASIQKLNKLDYQMIFCGHAGMIMNGKEMMHHKLNYLLNVRKEVIRLHRLGYSDRQIKIRLFPEKVKLEKMTFGSFSRLKLIRSCLK